MTAPGNNKLHTLISRIYDAALSVELWPSVLVELADYSGADAGHLLIIDGATGNSPWGAIGRADPERHMEYVKEYAALDKRLPRFLRYADYQPWTTQSLMSPEELLDCPVHNEFLKKNDVFHLMGATVSGMAGGTLVHAALRHEAKGRFRRAEINRWTLLLPHIQRSVQMLRRFQDMEAIQSNLIDALDKLTIGILLIDASGHVLAANQYAVAVMRDNDGITSEQTELRAENSEENRQLQYLLASTSVLVDESPTEAGGSLQISRPSGKRSFAVTVCPLPEKRREWGVRGATTIVFLNDPEKSKEIPENQLARLFNLTPAESRLTAALTNGVNLNDYAEQAGIKISTARSTLKQVLRKTNTRRQSELIRRVLLDTNLGTIG